MLNYGQCWVSDSWQDAKDMQIKNDGGAKRRVLSYVETMDHKVHGNLLSVAYCMPYPHCDSKTGKVKPEDKLILCIFLDALTYKEVLFQYQWSVDMIAYLKTLFQVD